MDNCKRCKKIKMWAPGYEVCEECSRKCAHCDNEYEYKGICDECGNLSGKEF